MTVAISTASLAAIRAHAARDHPDEACGILFGEPDRVVAMQACANVAGQSWHRFEIDPAALLAAHRAARAGGLPVIGCYHSHPRGAAEPSPEDARQAAPDGQLWLIAAGDQVTAWRAMADGAHLGRFAPVALRLVP